MKTVNVNDFEKEKLKVSEKNFNQNWSMNMKPNNKICELHPGELRFDERSWKRNCSAWCLASVFMISLCCATTMMVTNTLQQLVEYNLVLKNDTFRFEMWKKSPAIAHLKIYVFNYTNAERYGEAYYKFKVEEVGPFTYREIIEKVNITFNENGTISYQEKKTYHFVPELSAGDLLDTVFVPNIPMMGAVALVKDKSFWQKIAMSTLFGSLNSKPFIKTRIHGFLWGYEDKLFKLARGVISLKEEVPFVNFGIMAGKNGTGKEVSTIYSGLLDSSKTGISSLYKGQSSLKFWDTKECNRMDGTDASMFPASLVNKNAKLNIYNRDMCRKFPMVYKNTTYSADGFRSYRFNFSDEVFHYPEESCYCPDGENCPPNGVYNASLCTFGAPIFFSFPHFLRGDNSLFKNIHGLEPDEDKHSSYIDIHPIMGVPLSGKSRFQINVLHQAPLGITQLTNTLDDTILPASWLELSLDTLSPELVNRVSLISYALYFLSIFCTYGLFFVSFISLIFALRFIYYKTDSNFDRKWSFRHIQNKQSNFLMEKF